MWRCYERINWLFSKDEMQSRSAETTDADVAILGSTVSEVPSIPSSSCTIRGLQVEILDFAAIGIKAKTPV